MLFFALVQHIFSTIPLTYYAIYATLLFCVIIYEGDILRKRKGGFDAFTLDDYLITDKGDVINKRWGRKVKPQPNSKGYLRVKIAGEYRFVHRLVAEKYVPNPVNKPQVNHKDGDKTNNSAENLEWVSNIENRAHAVKTGLQIHGEKCPWAKLTQADVNFIRQHTEYNANELAKVFPVRSSHIRQIRRFETWK